MNEIFERRILYGFAIVAMLLVCASWFSTHVGIRRTEFYNRIERGHDIRQSLTALHLQIQRNESAEREFLLTGIDHASGDRDLSNQIDEAQWGDLSNLTAASPSQLHYVERLRHHVTRRQAFLAEVHLLGQQHEWRSASQALTSGSGPATLDRVEQDFDALQQEADRQLDGDRLALRIYEQDTGRLAGALRVIILFSLIGVFISAWVTGHRMHYAHQAQLRLTTMLAEQTTIDGLTGLKNHRAFQDRLEQEYDRACRYDTLFAVVLLDVDRFKFYNDTYGHPAGDDVLRTVATILQRTARDTDFVARYGGEEFVLLLPNTDATGAADAAERCRAAIAAHSWQRYPVTASFGVATLRQGSLSAGSLLSAADKALYASKANGRNIVTVAAVDTSTAVAGHSRSKAPNGENNMA